MYKCAKPTNCNKDEISGEVVMGPGRLSSSLPADTTPHAIRAICVKFGSILAVTTEVASDFGYKFAVSGRGHRLGCIVIYAGIPLRERLIGYDLANNVLVSIADDERDRRFIWLVEVPNNQQLRQILDPEHELCEPKAALYMYSDLMCPLYWLVRKDNGGIDIHIVSQGPPRASRAKMFGKCT